MLALSSSLCSPVSSFCEVVGCGGKEQIKIESEHYVLTFEGGRVVVQSLVLEEGVFPPRCPEMWGSQ